MRKQIIAGIRFLREPERASFKLSGKPLKRMGNPKSETETAYLLGLPLSGNLSRFSCKRCHGKRKSILCHSAEFAFAAVPAGNCFNGNFNDFGNNAYFWSATQNDDNNAWYRNLNSNDSNVNRNNDNKDNGFSVRCLRDNFVI